MPHMQQCSAVGTHYALRVCMWPSAVVCHVVSYGWDQGLHGSCAAFTEHVACRVASHHGVVSIALAVFAWVASAAPA
jgi:hypothetical protein